MGFKSHIENIIFFLGNIIYTYERVSNPTLKKYNFFLVNIKYIYERVLNPILKK